MKRLAHRSECLFVTLWMLSGCGGPSSQSADELLAARTAVTSSLDAWKKGEPAAKWDNEQAAIRFVDEDWKLGAALVSYKLSKAEGVRGENARCWTVLSVRDRKGRLREKEVVYSVKPGAPMIVTRDPFY